MTTGRMLSCSKNAPTVWNSARSWVRTLPQSLWDVWLRKVPWFGCLIRCNYHILTGVFKKKRHHKTPPGDANRGANLGPWLHHKQPLAGVPSGGLRKVARQCGQGCRFSPAGAGGGWRVEMWGLFFLCFDGTFGNVWHGFLYHIHQKHSKTICMWYTVCTNISKLICFAVGILRARQNFRSPTKTPKMNPNSEGPSRTGSPQTTAPWNQGPKKAGLKTGPVRPLPSSWGIEFVQNDREDSRGALGYLRWVVSNYRY